MNVADEHLVTVNTGGGRLCKHGKGADFVNRGIGGLSKHWRGWTLMVSGIVAEE